ncbi:hypothetical protein PB70LOC_04388 [Pectobacterium versatile]|nr:Hypothetical protein SCC1_0463 [Pectobacterium versatile]MBK4827779.1 hypothetical protein [Pectobacterium carotovorum subsp. carotovorum]POY54980.1 hypothetical protein PB70LOC_04388 [Pectobacterium versatile]POY62879.1 hypothetical protein PB69LOC_02831 [Pectobacterium versatile]TAI80941.1 hypothetical protein EG331_21625 [Pectobacterium versatile]
MNNVYDTKGLLVTFLCQSWGSFVRDNTVIFMLPRSTRPTQGAQSPPPCVPRLSVGIMPLTRFHRCS